MADLQRFKDRVDYYRKLQENPDTEKFYTYEDLGKEINLSGGELGKQLAGTSPTRLSLKRVHAIVVALTKWKTLTSWEDAVDLLVSMDYPFHTPSWDKEIRDYLGSPPQSVQDTFVTFADRRQEKPTSSSSTDINTQAGEKNLPSRYESQFSSPQVIGNNQVTNQFTGSSLPLSRSERQKRERILSLLHRTYRDLLAQSLQGLAWMQLGLTEKPEAVQNVTNLALRIDQRAEQSLPSGTSIIQVYEEARRELLILGEPGAGKSTLLLHLAQHLVAQAEQNATCLVPVLLPLSSWAGKQTKLEEWMAEQITQIYDVPRKVSQQLVQDEQILPLLDGLDEMDEDARPACIAAINAYHHAHLIPLVVCSRTAEYESVSSKQLLALQSAVVIQPLTSKQVDAALDQAEKAVAGLKTALNDQPELHDLATIPLMLNILILTYQGKSVPSLPSEQSILLQQVWDDYVQQMVAHKGDNKRYPLGKTRAWLSWLARQMQNNNQTIFYLENLQPHWLTVPQQQAYAWQAIRLPAIVIGVLISIPVLFFFLGDTRLSSLLQIGVMGGFLGWLCSELAAENGNQEAYHHAWGKRLAISICVGLIYGLSFGFKLIYDNTDYTFHQWQIDGLFFSIGIGLGSLLLQRILTLPRPRASSNNTRSRWKWVARFFQEVEGPRALLVTIIIGLSIGLSEGLTATLKYGLGEGLNKGLSEGLNNGLILGMSYVLIYLTLDRQMEDINLTERMRWTWRNLFRFHHLHRTLLFTCISTIFIGLIFGLTYGIRYGLDSGLSDGLNSGLSEGLKNAMNSGLSYGLGYGLILGLSYWFWLGFIQGIASERIKDEDRRIANEGIHRSLHNGVIIGSVGGTIIGSSAILSFGLSYALNGMLIFWLKYGLISQLGYGLNFGLTSGLTFGLNFALLIGISGAVLICILNGGLAAWRHSVIRFLLWRSHTFPLQAPQFFTDAKIRILLRCVGGGYTFSHRLLLDHLAARETGSAPSVNT